MLDDKGRQQVHLQSDSTEILSRKQRPFLAWRALRDMSFAHAKKCCLATVDDKGRLQAHPQSNSKQGSFRDVAAFRITSIGTVFAHAKIVMPHRLRRSAVVKAFTVDSRSLRF